MSPVENPVLQRTRNWVEQIVIGLNLCPFAEPVFKNDQIDYTIINAGNLEQHLRSLAECFTTLDGSPEIETSLIIFPEDYQAFDDYLELLYLSNELLSDLAYVGTYQLASFHPDYVFEGSSEDDAANFTNRSPYPMLHLIREHSLEKAISHYPDVEQVPENNIKKLREIGYERMKKRLEEINT
ncbi:MAG: DUF1415 domain-containing protein [Proteobacteria bacterium]|nr:DUF1415 domain-containing protein [Pseudomonadota bacterium]